MASVEHDPITLPDEEGSGRGSRIRLIILGIVVTLAVAYMVYAAFPGNTLYFLTVSEFMNGAQYQQNGEVVRVAGKLVPESFHRNDTSSTVTFQLIDKENTGASDMLTASYVGVVPDLFFNPESEIILQGKYSERQVFETDNILVKCPSKYQSLEDEQQVAPYAPAGGV